jgi:hypothetical protein
MHVVAPCAWEVQMNSDTVVLRAFANEMEAEIARSLLDAAGIPALIQRDDAGGMIPSLTFLRGAKLIVRSDDAEEAAAVLAAEAIGSEEGSDEGEEL